MPQKPYDDLADFSEANAPNPPAAKPNHAPASDWDEDATQVVIDPFAADPDEITDHTREASDVAALMEEAEGDKLPVPPPAPTSDWEHAATQVVPEMQAAIAAHNDEGDEEITDVGLRDELEAALSDAERHPSYADETSEVGHVKDLEAAAKKRAAPAPSLPPAQTGLPPMAIAGLFAFACVWTVAVFAFGLAAGMVFATQ